MCATPLPSIGLLPPMRSWISRSRWKGPRPVDAGLEFDLVTRIFDTTGNVPWESTSTNLIRKGSGGGGKKKSGWTPPDWSQYQVVESWQTPEDIGRRYGLIAGDVNPIHMHALAAKPFGFKRAIAHGMFSYARSVARIIPPGQEALQLTVAFKRPVFLPSRGGAAHTRGRAGA